MLFWCAWNWMQFLRVKIITRPYFEPILGDVLGLWTYIGYFWALLSLILPFLDLFRPFRPFEDILGLFCLYGSILPFLATGVYCLVNEVLPPTSTKSKTLQPAFLVTPMLQFGACP